jgi:hypothetical protein
MLPLDVGKEILIILKSCLKYSTNIRSNLYENLKEIIPKLDNELLSQIHNILSTVLNNYISNDELLLLTCFEDVGVETNQDYILKEAIHKLFQCIFQLNDGTIETEISDEAIIDGTLSQLSDFEYIFQFFQSGLKISQNLRNQFIFPLYEVFLEYSIKMEDPNRFHLFENYSLLTRFFKYSEYDESNISLDSCTNLLNEICSHISSVYGDDECCSEMKEGISLFSVVKLVEILKSYFSLQKYQNILQYEKYNLIKVENKFKNSNSGLFDSIITIFRNLFQLFDILLEHSLKDVISVQILIIRKFYSVT